ncbi:MAG: tryptophanase [Proteobacteria bacterium]|nr:tryptophanase [Pseudomonadota bacterium]
MAVKFYKQEHQVPLEMHKVRIVQKLFLPPVEERVRKINEAGNNTFLLQNRDVFMDMLTDSGVNAMSDLQQAAMLHADDAYAGSETCNRLKAALLDVFGTPYFLPAHQGRACENILSEAYVKPGMICPMNFHFTTAKAHITRCGGEVIELVRKEGLEPVNHEPFKGNFDIPRLKALIAERKKDIAFLRIETGTNLIGGQPISMENMLEVLSICRREGIRSVIDASLLQDNLYFIKVREPEYKHAPIRDIMHKLAEACDIIYFSSRKLGFSRGGAIITMHENIYRELMEFVPLYEGFLTYGGMEVRSMEAMAQGLYETLDMEIISQGPIFIEALVRELVDYGVPMIEPAGGLGAHINASAFLEGRIPSNQYPAGALAAALYIAGGIRGMERGSISEQREPDGTERYAELELLRLAVPRRVFTLSQIKYCADRVKWLYDNRELIGGLKWVEEPKVLRFFFGRLAPIGDWQEKIARKFREDFGDSL